MAAAALRFSVLKAVFALRVFPLLTLSEGSVLCVPATEGAFSIPFECKSLLFISDPKPDQLTVPSWAPPEALLGNLKPSLPVPGSPCLVCDAYTVPGTFPLLGWDYNYKSVKTVLNLDSIIYLRFLLLKMS